MVMTIAIGVSAWVVLIVAAVLVSCGGCPIFVPMLGWALLVWALLVSMFILAVLRVQAEWDQGGHRECAEGKYYGPHQMLHDGEPLLLRTYD